MKTSEFNYKAKMTVSDLSALFKGLVKSMEEGALVLETGEKFIALKPAADLDVTLEAAVKKDKEKLEISLSWTTAPCECKAAALKISSKEPVAPKPEPAADEKPAAAAGAKAHEVKKA